MDAGAQYIDLSLYKKVGDGEVSKLSSTAGNELEITIEIPDSMKSDKPKRSYCVIRVHKDGASVETDVLLSVHDRTNNTLTFKTDRFSTYAVAYTEPNDFIPVTGVVLNTESGTITSVGGTIQLTVVVSPLAATDRSVSWASSDTGVATVDETGKVTAVGNGTCAITATTNDGQFRVVCTVTVNIQSDNGSNAGSDNGSTENNEAGSTDSGSTAGSVTGNSESGSTGAGESGSGDAGNTGNGENTGNGQITAPSTGREGASGRMIPVVVFVMAAIIGSAAVYVRKKRMIK